MPNPNEGESHDDFIERCIPMVMDEGTAEDNDQAVAICNSMWEEHHQAGAQTQEVRGMNFIRAFREVTEGDEMGTPIRFVASTEGFKRDGKDLKAGNWRLDNYKSNPVVLWAHDYMSQPPIGKADVAIDGKALVASVTFDQQDEFARTVEGKYRRGFLNAVSVGWQDIAEGKRTFHDLMDVSAVPVPADPMALKLQEARAWQFEFAADARLSDVSVWEGVAAAMVALYSARDAIEDETRHGLYIALERAYRKLGKTAPEFRTLDELTALSGAEVRGLFLEDEYRVGAVLSSRNRGDLEQAITLVRGVLERAKKEEEPRSARQPSDGEMGNTEKMKAMLQTMMDMMDEMMGGGEEATPQGGTTAEQPTEQRDVVLTLHDLFTRQRRF